MTDAWDSPEDDELPLPRNPAVAIMAKLFSRQAETACDPQERAYYRELARKAQGNPNFSK